MFRRFFKWLGLALAAIGLVVAVFVVNAIWFRPFQVGVFFERVFLQYALQDPELLTSIGLLDGVGIRGHNGELTEVSPQRMEWLADFTDRQLTMLRSYDRARLEGQTALSYDVLENYLEQQASGRRFLWHGYPVSQLGGAHVDLPELMMTQQRVDDEKGARLYVKRLGAFEKKFEGLVASLELRREKGIVPPHFVIERVLEQIRSFREATPEENPLVKTFVERVAKLGLDAKTTEELGAEARSAVETSVYPAYDLLVAHFEKLEAEVTTDHGIWALPDGDAYYDHLLRGFTTTDLGAAEIHRRGLAEVERIVAEMDGILAAEGYVDGTVAERMNALTQEERFRWPEGEGTREAILEGYRQILAEITPAMGDWFRTLPRSECEVVAIPEHKQHGSPGAYYQGPSLDGSRPGRFFANLADLDSHYRFGMRTLTYHEAVPGHHFQTSLQTELTGVPQFRRILPFTAFSEGWGLYAERLAWEAGFQKDPFDNLGRLQAELFRAVRLVVDTGIHRQRWSREQAIDTMASITGMPVPDVTREIERYFVNPGQATAYKVGMMKILDLREHAKAVLGDRFDIRDFHERVLRNGDLPLDILEREIDRWIAEADPQGDAGAGGGSSPG